MPSEETAVPVGTVRNGESHGFPNGAGLTDYVAVIGVNIAQSGKDKRPRCLAGRERIENTASIMTELMQKQVNAMKHYYLGVCHKKDGQVVIGDWCRTHREASDRARTLCYIERRAKLQPECDWRAELSLPLRSAIYQRQEQSKWVLVKTGVGFT